MAMVSTQIQRTIERACVTLVKHIGRGVVIPGNLVLTAAHCVAYTTEGAMALGDYDIEELQTIQGSVKCQPLAVEPVTDIALLGALDVQEFSEDHNAFEAFCDRTTPVPVGLEEFPLFHPFPVFLYTHTGRWMQGSALQCAADAWCLQITMPEAIEGGSSGSPMVTEQGELIGIVSNTTDGAPSVGMHPRPHLSLPVWAMRRLQAAQLR
jgi:hypothetical protein